MTDKIYYFISKVKNRINVIKCCIYSRIAVDKISLIGIDLIGGKTDLLSKLHLMLGRDLHAIVLSADHEERDMIINSAENTCKHEFDLLGSGPVKNDPINWSVELKTGFVWPLNLYYTKQRSVTPQGSDIKFPWELSRCHHLLWLGEAFILTGDDKYAKEVVDEIDDWIDNNPLMYSVNWTCSMDVAIRAVSMMYALLFIEQSELFDDNLTLKVYRSLFQHAFFIGNNLEKQIPYSNNHYTSDIVGLLYLGQLFNNCNSGRKWKRFALKEFYKEIRQQTLLSGVHYERSISYHRLMVELHSYPLYMLVRCGEGIPDDVSILVKNMYKFSVNYTKPNGFAPLIADNDDGRFLPFVKRDFREHGYLNDGSSLENSIISTGCSYSFASNNIGAEIYEDAGFAVLRNKEAYVFVSNGGFSKRPKDTDTNIPTHTHNDLLAFDFSLGKFDVIVDPGTYLYTSSPKDRNEFRSTRKHNTIIVDEEEQNFLPERNIFLMERNVKIGKLTDHGNFVTGSYSTLKGCFQHERSFELKENELILRDVLSKAGNGHQCKMFLHFAEKLVPEIVEQKVRLILPDYLIEVVNNSNGTFEILNDNISPSYGVLKQSKTLVFTFEFDEKKEIKTNIIWTRMSSTK